MVADARFALRSGSPWIVGRAFDLAFFFGGAPIAAAVAVLTVGFGVPIAPLWWAWLLAFDGPHMLATYSRTYLDRSAWRERRTLLLLSPLAVLLGPAALAVSVVTGSDAPFLGFLGLATAYGYHHVVRQHYGFLALYEAKRGPRAKRRSSIDRAAIVVGGWAPYLGFLATHPRARAMLGLEPDAPAWALAPFVAAWALALGALVVGGLGGRGRAQSLPKIGYAVVTLGLLGAAYFVVARYEPVYSASSGPDEDFLLLSVMVALMHGMQYVALVFVHNRSRHGAGGDGTASWLSRSPAHFLFGCAAFSLVYFAIASSTGVFPVVRSLVGAKIGALSVNRLVLASWWGLALHHYALDYFIWRLKDDARLRAHLGLAATVTPERAQGPTITTPRA